MLSPSDISQSPVMKKAAKFQDMADKSTAPPVMQRMGTTGKYFEGKEICEFDEDEIHPDGGDYMEDGYYYEFYQIIGDTWMFTRMKRPAHRGLMLVDSSDAFLPKEVKEKPKRRDSIGVEPPSKKLKHASKTSYFESEVKEDDVSEATKLN